MIKHLYSAPIALFLCLSNITIIIIIIIIIIVVRKETEALLQNMSAEAEDCLRTYILKTVKHKVSVRAINIYHVKLSLLQ